MNFLKEEILYINILKYIYIFIYYFNFMCVKQFYNAPM